MAMGYVSNRLLALDDKALSAIKNIVVAAALRVGILQLAEPG
jgi:hypothetical protein